MLNANGDVIYVGKAKNLKKRVSTYFTKNNDIKTERLVQHIADFQVTITRSEREALLLEHSLIQELKPKYNILFRDDKSYPYIWLQTHDFPRLTFFRGEPSSKKGQFYGPYPNVRAVKDSLDVFQKIFKLRHCDNTYFKNRSRPCLQYQIKRCSAPCVGLISKEHYAESVLHLQALLEGQTTTLIKELEAEMNLASDAMQYEKAATLRDQIADLRILQNKQIILPKDSSKLDVDVLGVAESCGQVCIHQLLIRGGQLLGSRQYFPKSHQLTLDHEPEILSFFLMLKRS